jgi:hypothetical protein
METKMSISNNDKLIIRNLAKQYYELASDDKQQKMNERMKATNDLTARMVKATDEADVARAEAANLRLELKERECRIDELVKRVKWLESQLPL